MSVRATTSGGVMGSLVKSLDGVTHSLKEAGRATTQLEKNVDNFTKQEKKIKNLEEALARQRIKDLREFFGEQRKQLQKMAEQKEATEKIIGVIQDERDALIEMNAVSVGALTILQRVSKGHTDEARIIKNKLELARKLLAVQEKTRFGGDVEGETGQRELLGLQKSMGVLNKTIEESAEAGILPTEERRADIEERARPSAITDVVKGGVALKGLKAGTTALSQQATSIKETIKGIVGYRNESDKLEDTIKETKRVSTDYKLELKGLKIVEKELIRTSKDRRLGLARVDEALTQIKENQEEQVKVKLDLDNSDKKILETQIKLKKLRDEEGEKVTQLKRGYQFLGLAATATMGALIAASPKLRTELTLMRLEFMFMAMALGDELAPAFKIVRKEIQGMGDDFDELPDSRKQLIAFTIGGAAALFVLMSALILTTKWLGGVKTALATVGKALGGATLGTVGWIAILVALVLALIFMQFKADEVYSFLEKKIDSTDGKMRVFWITVLALAHGFEITGDIIILIVKSVFGVLVAILWTLGEMFVLVIDLIGDFVRGLGDIRDGDFMGMFTRMGDSITTFWDSLKDMAEWVIGFFKDAWSDAFGSSWFIDWFIGAINALLTPFTTLWGYFTDTIDNLKEIMIYLTNKFDIVGFFENALDFLLIPIQGIIDGVISIKDIFIDFMGYLNGISFDFLGDAWEGVMGQIKNTITNAWDSFKSFTDDVADALGKLNPFGGGGGGGGTGVDYTGESTAGQPIVYSGETREEIGARLLTANPSWGFERLLAAIEAEFNRQQLAAIEAAAGGIYANNLRGFATGTPFVPQTQVAVVHKGERIIPANQNRGNGANNITIAPVFQVTITGTNNEEEIIRRISERTLDEIQRLVNTI